MVTIDRSTPVALRHLIYISHHVTRIARAVVAEPWQRSSWGMLLNLPAFGVVVPGRVYRSGSPRAAVHYRQLLELGVKTLICVRYGGPSRELRAFAAEHGIGLRVFNLDVASSYDLDEVCRAAEAALDPSAQPALICCEGGRHHAGVVSALVRVETGYTLEQAIAEYFAFAAPSPFPDNVLCIVRAAQHARRRSLTLLQSRSLSAAE